jgi:hypothetical protein
MSGKTCSIRPRSARTAQAAGLLPDLGELISTSSVERARLRPQGEPRFNPDAGREPPVIVSWGRR